ncbi:hypothetical protein BP00DRAFT_426993 [Aspergillus indologenus CBS 114.80]|uniref:Uncharacterized protein n=1 Tax=Aspergillus indologenus CBS 114.80 TaxID=1450541 RepID=A0A2V5I7H8_9EURO|nr:hypothetical protein BP00DRAFT_426993 [Aspergillus indologenus CBS 114.80]
MPLIFAERGGDHDGGGGGGGGGGSDDGSSGGVGIPRWIGIGPVVTTVSQSVREKKFCLRRHPRQVLFFSLMDGRTVQPAGAR